MNTKLNAENWAVELEQLFFEVGMILGAVCGIIVIFSEEENGYVEKANFGYGEEGFFYEFLRSEGEEFKKIANSNVPITYSVQSGILRYSEKTRNILVHRIYRTVMNGFVLMEFPFESISFGVKWIFALFSEKLAEVIESKKVHQSTQNHSGPLDGDTTFVHEILDSISNLKEKLDFLKAMKYLYLITEKGKLKTRVVQYLHKVLNREGELLYLNYLPEQVGKFEKSLNDWLQIAKDGTIVVERCSEMEPSQQRIFFEKMSDNKENIFFVFWDELDSQNPSLYTPFQKLLQNNTIKIPRFSMIDREKRLFFLQGLFKEVCNLLNRKKIQLTHEALLFMEEKSLESELGKLEYVLEEAILKCKRFELTKEDLERVWNERAAFSSLFDLDDLNLRKSVEALERQKILLAHRIFSGNQLRMAKALGISRGSLQYKMKQMGI